MQSRDQLRKVTPAGASVCRLCGDDAIGCGVQRVLDRHEVRYFRCTGCDLIQTESPFWLEEAYSDAISALDTGAIERNKLTARLTILMAGLLGLPATAECLDYGGAHGVFVRMMRDLGLDFVWYDRYAANLYARGFQGDCLRRYELVTSFEVFEHFSEVDAEMAALFAPRHPFIFVGTVLHDGYKQDWWYLAPESGQHVAFYSAQTMRWLGERFGYSVEVGPTYSLFVEMRYPLNGVRRAMIRAALRRPWLAYGLCSLIPDPLLGRVGKCRSRVHTDHLLQRTRLASSDASRARHGIR